MKLNTIKLLLVFLFVLTLSQTNFAAVTPEIAATLKTTLTPFGAERAGNKDGTIPAWDGGYTTVPPGYKSGEVRPDPFAGEKPLYSVTGQNMDKYADKLSEGLKALLKKYPEFRMDVYPTHRTAAAPQYVYDNTFVNATSAKLLNDGQIVEGAYGGIPFPIPANGDEVMWNHKIAWRGVAVNIPFRNYLRTTNGDLVLTAEAEDLEQYDYYRNDIPREQWNGKTWLFLQRQTAPAFKAGETILAHDDLGEKGQTVWQYLVGQRRVRRAPSISYDTPDFVNSGHNYFDENWIFNGKMDRFDFKLVGKKEMLIPYNCNEFFRHKDKEVLASDYLNPDYVRWELHRVWVVEGTLTEGKRHVVPKRRYYLDEDTWRAFLYDGWDGQDELWRFILTVPLLAMEYPAVMNYTMAVFNLQTGAYGVNNIFNEMSVQMEKIPPYQESYFAPEALAGSGR